MDLGIEFSEIEELKTRYRDDLNRLRREHYNEMNKLTARYLRLQEDIRKFVSTNDDKEKKIDKLRNVYLEEVFELEKVKNNLKVERLIKKGPDVLPEEYLRKKLRKCQATNRRSKVIKTLMKSQGNENHVPENEGDEINRQENTSSSDEDETVEDQDCRNEISSSMKMNKMETHTTVYNISQSNVNLNTHCTVKQSDGVLSVEPGDPGLPMLTENES